MPLYLISPSNPEFGTCLVRAANGDAAQQFVGCGHAVIERVREEGPTEVILQSDGDQLALEVEITSLGDKERRFRNLRTGKERTVPRTAPGQGND